MNAIRNCEFRFKCPKDWDALEPTDRDDERYCNECNQIVYFSKTGKQLMAAIKEDRCVAVKILDPESDLPRIEVGMPAPKYNIKKHHCPNCGTKTGIPQPDTSIDHFEGLNAESRPITYYQCSKCGLKWRESV